ncbi:MAG: tetratricopeptide repeat protein, partial [Thermomicrobiales bacterium]
AAVDWLRDQGQTEEALRLGGALWRFWWLRGDMAEGRKQLEVLLRQSAPVAPAVRAKALNGAGVLAESQGDLACAERFHQESLQIARSLGDVQGVAWSLNNLGVVAINQGDYARARLILEENLAVAERAGDTISIATALLDLGQIAHYEGDQERARTLFTRSLELFRELGNESHMARALNNLGLVLFAFDEHDQAHALLSESLALHRQVGDRQGIASTLNNLAGAASRRGESEVAMGYFRESHMLALAERNDLYAAIAMEGLATMTHLHGDERVALYRFREALRLYRGAGDQQGVITCLAALAAGAASQARPEEAASILGAAAELSERHEQLPPAQMAETAQTLRDELGDAAFEVAWLWGKAMGIDEVVHQMVEASRPDVSSRDVSSRGNVQRDLGR